VRAIHDRYPWGWIGKAELSLSNPAFESRLWTHHQHSIDFAKVLARLEHCQRHSGLAGTWNAEVGTMGEAEEFADVASLKLGQRRNPASAKGRWID
jgi:hypothetical protein